MRRLAFLFVLLCSLPAFSQAKHPFTFEDMMKLKRVGEPVPSPDGKWVLFSAVDVDLAANKKTPHIWIVPLAGGQEREIIPDQDGDRPRWAPDGKRFAFLSTKEGGSQIWIADFDGPAGKVTGVHKLTAIKTEAGGELWSPDGKNILFTSDVYPECDGAPDSEVACNAKKSKEAEESKVKAIIFDRLLYRHWNAYKRGMRTHILVIPVDACVGTAAPGCPAGKARDLTPGDYDAPPFSLGGQDDYAYSPDGKYIAYRAQQRPGYESDRFRLMLYDRKTREKFGLTEDFDKWVGSFAWAPDSESLYFTAEEKGESPLYWVGLWVDLKSWGPGDNDVETSKIKIEPLVRGFNDDVAVAGDGKSLLFTRMSLGAPTEIYGAPSLSDPLEMAKRQECKFSVDSSGRREFAGCGQDIADKLTHINDAVLSQAAMSPLESFWFEGAKGDKVEGFLVKPPNFDPTKKYPVKFLIHGGPQGAWGDDWSYRWNPELFAANGYVVVMINFHGSTGYGQKFIDAINGDWGGAPYDDLMMGLDYAEKTYPFIDKDRECALGASFGGYMANWVLGHTDRFKCIVSHDGTFNNESDWGTTEELWFNEWEFHGTPYTNRFTTLQRLGVPSKMLYFPDEGHWVLKPQNSQLWWKTVTDWVDQWTKK